MPHFPLESEFALNAERKLWNFKKNKWPKNPVRSILLSGFLGNVCVEGGVTQSVLYMGWGRLFHENLYEALPWGSSPQSETLSKAEAPTMAGPGAIGQTWCITINVTHCFHSSSSTSNNPPYPNILPLATCSPHLVSSKLLSWKWNLMGRSE